MSVQRKKILFYRGMDIFFLAIGFFILFPPFASAQLKLQVPVENLVEISKEQLAQGNGIAVYLVAAYTWFVAAITMLAVLCIMIGGIIWLTAAGNPQRVGLGKKFVTDSLWGLAIVLGSYIFLATINPNLIKFKPIKTGKKISEHWDINKKILPPSV